MHRLADFSARPNTGAVRRDMLASVIVFLVALPLCLGIARACGMPPAAGLLTGIIGGLVVGLICGSPLQVSGPAAGLIVLVAMLVRDQGPAALAVVLILAGIIQIAAGFLKLGQWFRAVSPAVIEGMLAGIGLLIFASQFHLMIDDVKRSDGLADMLAIPVSIGKVFHPGGDVHRLAGLIATVTIAVLVIWKLVVPKKWQIFPAPLVAVVLASTVAYVWALPIQFVQLPDNLFQAVSLPSVESLKFLSHPEIWRAAVTVALVASAETLLCAGAVDQMHQGPRTRFDRELSAQGVGNLLCGLVGGLPMTGVIVRSSANVQAGGKTRLSTMLHGLWLLLFVLLLPGVLKLIPSACLAGILVYTGANLVNVAEARRLYRESRSEFVIFLVTMIVVVATDLLTGVLTGLTLAALKLLFTFSRLGIRKVEHPERGRTELHLDGAATFLRLPRLAAKLERVPPGTELHVHFEKLTYIDHACLELLMNWEKQHESTGGSLAIDWDVLRAKFHSPRPKQVA